jgi:hypothetical protein
MGVAFGQMSALLRRKATGHVVRVFEVTGTTRTVRTGESGSTFTNLGATATQTYTLPTAAKKGIQFTFVVQADYAIRLEPGATNAFYHDAAKQSDGKYLELTRIGTSVTIQSDSAHDWVVIAPLGTTKIED